MMVVMRNDALVLYTNNYVLPCLLSSELYSYKKHTKNIFNMPPKRNLTLDEALDDINAWIDENNDPDDDMVSDLCDLNGDSEGNNNDDDEEEVLDAIDDVLSEAEDDEPIQRHRKPLTRKRKVNSIDSALNIENYNPIDNINCSGEWEDLTGFLGPMSKPTTEKIIWTNQTPALVGRQRACDVITSPVSSLQLDTDITNEVDAFELFMDRNMIDLIVNQQQNKRHYK